jgi:hypothetical protein
MRSNQTKRLRDLEGRGVERELGPAVWLHGDQTFDEARAAAGLAPDAPCVFFRWSAAQ